MNINIHKNDTVVILQGKDQGKKGKVVRVMPKKSQVVVEGLNLSKKHLKPKRTGQTGQLVDLEQPLPISRVQLFCEKCGRPSRVGFILSGDKKARVCKRCNSDI